MITGMSGMVIMAIHLTRTTIMNKGWYYLHTNGDLIYKNYEDPSDIRDSDFAVGLWKYQNDRGVMWSMLVEALAAGANKQRIDELVVKWGADNEDAKTYAEYIGCNLIDLGDRFQANGDTDRPFGCGNTALEAMADLCKNLGYKPTKMWGATFRDLLRG